MIDYVKLAAVIGHLIVVTLGAAHCDLSSSAIALGLYGAASGAGGTYGFFAPEVGSEMRARLLVTTAGGGKFATFPGEGASREIQLRLGNAFAQIKRHESQDFKRSLSASFAAHILNRAPNGKSVVVTWEEFIPVDMAAFRAGQRPFWRPIYRANFIKNGSR